MSIVRREYWISLVLFAATLAAYWQVGRNGFVDYDDREYVTQNRQSAVRLKPDLASARRNLKVALEQQARSSPHP